MENLNKLKKEDIYLVTFGKPSNKIDKARIRPVKDYFQLEYFMDKKAYHKNMSFEETISRIQEYIKEYFKDCVVYTKENDIHYFRNSKNIIKSKLHKSSKTKPNKEHNRYKNYLLSNPEQYKFLYYLGISDENGRIYDKGQKSLYKLITFYRYLTKV